MNTVPGRVVGADGDGLAVALPGRRRTAAGRAREPARRNADIDDVVVGVRPEHLVLGARRRVPATVVSVVESLGHERHIVCRLDDGTMVITRQPADDRRRRSRVRTCSSRPSRPQFHVFDAESGATRVGAA